jgi:beta-1,4-mannosyl-glycoprotein beta-1,4-N-acetylglucosaminyltransferase
MKIINCFPFYNEVDLLEYKLSILNDYVDYFILVEFFETKCRKIEMLQLNDEDIIISGDLDEIVNPELLVKIKDKELEINHLP